MSFDLVLYYSFLLEKQQWKITVQQVACIKSEIKSFSLSRKLCEFWLLYFILVQTAWQHDRKITRAQFEIANFVWNKSLSNLAVNLTWFEANPINMMKPFVNHKYKSLFVSTSLIKSASTECVEKHVIHSGRVSEMEFEFSSAQHAFLRISWINRYLNELTKACLRNHYMPFSHIQNSFGVL